MQDLRVINRVGQTAVDGGEAVELAAWVIGLVMQRKDTVTGGIRPGVLAGLMKAITSEGSEVLAAFLRDLSRQKITAVALADQYVPAAARLLGEKWNDDEISFTEVTIGSARLQYIMRCVGAAWKADDAVSVRSATVLLVTPEREQHTLGALVVMGQLRRLGISVALAFGAHAEGIARKVRNGRYDGVMISCSSMDFMHDVRALVGAVRRNDETPVPVVVGGLVANWKDEVLEATGADDASNDLMAALRIFGLSDAIEYGLKSA